MTLLPVDVTQCSTTELLHLRDEEREARVYDVLTAAVAPLRNNITPTSYNLHSR